jgi:hypothetical protein
MIVVDGVLMPGDLPPCLQRSLLLPRAEARPVEAQRLSHRDVRLVLFLSVGDPPVAAVTATSFAVASPRHGWQITRGWQASGRDLRSNVVDHVRPHVWFHRSLRAHDRPLRRQRDASLACKCQRIRELRIAKLREIRML